MTDVLVLNSDYRPLNVTALKRAVRLLFAGKAEVVHNRDRAIGSVSFEMPLPSIIRMLYYIKNGRVRVALTKKNVLLRDNYECNQGLVVVSVRGRTSSRRASAATAVSASRIRVCSSGGNQKSRGISRFSWFAGIPGMTNGRST
jgi:hypothetical protein